MESIDVDSTKFVPLVSDVPLLHWNVGDEFLVRDGYVG